MYKKNFKKKTRWYVYYLNLYWWHYFLFINDSLYHHFLRLFVDEGEILLCYSLVIWIYFSNPMGIDVIYVYIYSLLLISYHLLIIKIIIYMHAQFLIVDFLNVSFSTLLIFLLKLENVVLVSAIWSWVRILPLMILWIYLVLVVARQSIPRGLDPYRES